MYLEKICLLQEENGKSLEIRKCRSSRPEVFCKAGLRAATLLKKRFRHRCFPVNLSKFFRSYDGDFRYEGVKRQVINAIQVT